MLKIDMSVFGEEKHRKVNFIGDTDEIMAEMLSALHIFYNRLPRDEDRETLKNVFKRSEKYIFAKDGEFSMFDFLQESMGEPKDDGCESCENKDDCGVNKLNNLISALDEIKGILKELAE